MARDRIYGADVPFMAWCRNNKRLPSFSMDCGWVQTDVDTFVHRYITAVDALGSRELQPMMEIEVKTRGAMPSRSQEDTLRKKHLSTRFKVRVAGQEIRNFGVSIVSLDGTNPDDSSTILWCRFDPERPHSLSRRRITADEFVELLLFERHPDSLNTQPFRRHHATRVIREAVIAPLGYPWETTTEVRS